MLSPDYLFNSDPTLHVIDGRLYMFATHDQTSERFITENEFWNNMYDYHALSTTDFRRWVDHGSIFRIHDVTWAKGTALWDGDAGIEANGRYYAYVPGANSIGTSDSGEVAAHEDGYVPFDFAIGVLVSDHPAGPYVDALGHPLITKDTPGVTCKMLVSPSVIFDDGVPYLIFGWHGLNIARLKPNMIELDGDPVTVDTPDDYVESPIIAKIDGRFYLTYSCGGLWGEGYPPPQIRYAVSDSLLGPYRGSSLLQDIQVNPEGQGFEKTYASSAHQGLACYEDTWYFAYHRDSKDKFHRHACITRLDVHADGSLGVIDPNTDEGVFGGPIDFVLDAFAPNRREAAEFHERSGAQEEHGDRQAFHFLMEPGGYLRFDRMDFQHGATGMRLAVSCDNPALVDGSVEVRLGDPAGRLIGTAPVPRTGTRTDYAIVEVPVEAVGGIHDVFLVAQGEGVDARGHLFTISWFTFTRD